MQHRQYKFTFDFDETAADPPPAIASSIDGTVWQCPHNSVADADLCAFHLPPAETPPGLAQERLIAEVRSDGATNIYGAVFNDLSLRYQNLRADTRHPIDLSHITVKGTLDLTNAVVDRPLILGHGRFNRINLNDAYFIDEVRFQRSEFQDDVTLVGTECRSLVEFSEATFEQTVDLSQGIFRGPVHFDVVDVGRFFADGAEFHETANLQQTDFETDCSFRNASFDGDLRISDSDVAAPGHFNAISVTGAVYSNRTAFAGDCTFESGTITEGLHLGQGRIGGQLSVADADIEGVVELGEVALADTVIFSNAIIKGRVLLTGSAIEATLQFEGVTVTGTIRMTGAALQSPVSFKTATIEGTLDLHGAAVRDRLSLRGATIDDFELSDATIESDLDLRGTTIPTLSITDIEAGPTAMRVDASGATLGSGHPEVGGDTPLWVDCRGGTLGDVRFTSLDDCSVFDYLRIQNTIFDRYDFQDYRTSLYKTAFTLHTVPAVAEVELPTLTPTEREVTYMRAKQGATAIEDDVARRNFFERQMQARRQQYFERLRPSAQVDVATRFEALTRWATGLFLSFSCGYGERPNRVLTISVGTIVIYASFYRLSDALPTDGSVFEALLLSLQGFVALIIGLPNTVGPMGTILVISEAFLGAIFLSLFVVTLTRSFDVGSG